VGWEAAARRDEILDAIRETAANNGGKPLGRNRFEQLTAITEYVIGRYWARWGDAVREAGLEPNTLNTRLDDHHLLEKYFGLVARLHHVPTKRRAAPGTRTRSHVPERQGLSAVRLEGRVSGEPDRARCRTLPASAIAVVPDATVPTAASRASLPASVPHADAAFTAARAVLLGASGSPAAQVLRLGVAGQGAVDQAANRS
jgi:hypothetical protein